MEAHTSETVPPTFLKNFSKDLDLNLSLDSLEESDSESLTQEIKYQSELRDWIHDNKELVDETSEGQRNSDTNKHYNDAKSRQNVILDEQAESTNSPHSERRVSEFSKTSLQKEDVSYSDLRYNPDWKKHQWSEQDSISYQDLDDFSDDSSISSDYVPIEETSPQVKNNGKPLQNDLSVLTTRKKEYPPELSAKHRNGLYTVVPDFDKNVSSTVTGNADFKGAAIKNRNELAELNSLKHDFIENNKHTLGLHAPKKQQSYLHIHRKKTVDVPEKDPQNKSRKTVKMSRNALPEEKSHIVNLHHPSGMQKHMFKEAKLENADTVSEISEDSEHENNGLKSNMLMSKIKYCQKNNDGFSSKQPFDEYLAAAHNSSHVYKNNHSPGSLLNVDLTLEEHHQCHRWQIQDEILYSQQNEMHQMKEDRQTNYDIVKLDRNLRGQSNSKSRDTYNGLQNLMEPCLTPHINSNVDNSMFTHNQIIQPAPSNGLQFSYNILKPTLNKENNSFLIHEEIKNNIHTSPDLDCYDLQVKRNQQMEEKQRKKIIDYLKQDVKLGGMGPNYIVSKEKKEQLQKQKKYAEEIEKRNKSRSTNTLKVPEMQIIQSGNNKGARQKSLEYAKKIAKPSPLPKPSGQKRDDETDRHTVAYEKLFPQIKLLQELQIRHEKEKVAVAAFNALHII